MENKDAFIRKIEKNLRNSTKKLKAIEDLAKLQKDGTALK